MAMIAPTHAATHASRAVHAGWRRLARAIVAAAQTLYTWQVRSRTRRQLMELDHRLLRDMGLSRYDALFEGRKPFWRE